MLNKYSSFKQLSFIIISISLLASCSKKALTELASTEGQNQQGDSNNGGQDGNLNSNINTVNEANKNMYLANFDSSFNTVNGMILSYHGVTGQFTDITPNGSILPLYSNESGSSTYYNLNLKTGVFHGSIEKTGSFVFQEDQGQYQMMYFKYSDNSLTTLGVYAGSANPFVAYSSNYAMVTNQGDSINYVVSATQAQPVNTLLGLDTSSEDLRNPMFLPLGKGYFAAFSQLSGQSSTNKLMTFKAQSPHQIQRLTSDHQYLFMGGYSEESVYFVSANANYDFDFYFLTYSDGQMTKVLSTLSTELQMVYGFQDINNDYYLLMKDLVNSLYVVKKINATTGAVTQIANQSSTSSLINECGTNTMKVEKNLFNQKIYLSCEVNALDGNNNAIKNSVGIIINGQAQSIVAQTFMTDIRSGYTYLFSYKGELYIQKDYGEHSVVNTTTDQIGAINDNQLHTDLREYCEAELTGYNCNQITIAGASGGSRNTFANPMIEEDLRTFFVGIDDADNVSQSFVFVLTDTGIDSRIPITTFGDMIFSNLKIQIRNLSVPMFAGM